MRYGMLIFMAIGCLVAKARGMKIAPIFRDWSLIPLAISEAVYIGLEICILIGEYRVIRFAGAIQMAFLLSTLAPILRHRLYWQAIAGFGLILSGTTLNKIAMRANSGTMPVYPTFSRKTGYFTYEALASAQDKIHVLMTDSTKLKFLCDYIDMGYSILSPGDVLIHTFAALVLYGVVRGNNKSVNAEVEGHE